MTAIATLLVVLAVIGVITVVRRRRTLGHGDAADGEPSPAWFRVPLVGAAAAVLVTLLVASQALRYEADFLPLLVMAGGVGLFALARYSETRATWTRWATIGVVTMLALWSCWATFALTLTYQREFSGFQPTELRAGYLGFQLDVNEWLGLDPPSVTRVTKLPVIGKAERLRTDVPHGELYVVGDCDELYVSGGRNWQPIEARVHGQRRWRVVFEEAEPGTRVPLWSAGTGPYHILFAKWIDHERVRLEYEWTGAPYAVAQAKRTWRIEPGRTYDLDVRLDPTVPYMNVRHGSQTVFESFASSFDTDDQARLGKQPDAGRGATVLPGSIENVPLMPLCQALTGTQEDAAGAATVPG
jgi:hypothetical protein